MVIYSKNKKELLKRLYLKLYSEVNESEKYSGTQYIKIERIIYILSDIIHLKKGDINEPTKRNILRKCAIQCKLNRKSEFEKYIESINEYISKKSEFHKYSAYIPVSIRLQDFLDIKNIFIDILDLDSKNEEELFNELSFDLNTTEQLKYKIKEDNIQNIYWYKTIIYSDSPMNAFNILNKKSNMMRSLINFGLLYGIESIRHELHVLSKVPPYRYLVIIDSESKYASFQYQLEHFNYSTIRISKDEKEKLNRIITKILGMKESEIKNTIFSIIKLYNDALDHSLNEYSFLIFWSIADIILPNIETNKELIKGLFKEEFEEMKYLVDALYTKRNMIIHRGSLDAIDDNDINRIRDIIDALISFLIRVSDKFKTLEEVEILLNRLLKKKNLKTEEKILEYIKNLA